MNIRNAWGFLSFGLVMSLLPLLLPASFPPTGIDGTSARALWLQLMGGVQTLLGGARVFWQVAWPAVIRWLARRPSPRIVPRMVTQTGVPTQRLGRTESDRVADAVGAEALA